MADRSDWRPTAALDVLRRRARMMEDIRAYFRERGVLEVETPQLSHAASTEPHLHSLAVRAGGGGELYLHTSPEYPMKRLLAAGSGPIWQACRVFREGEAGRRHNPEFSLLEWYRPGFTLDQLMDEVAGLVRAVGGPAGTAETMTYREAFERHAGLDPFRAAPGELARCAARHGLDAPGADMERSQWQDWLFGALVCPALPAGRPVFITRFPAGQASLARLCDDDPECAERFEFFIGPLELANGYHELADPVEQAARFEADNEARDRAGLPRMPVDRRLLAALAAGLPDCCGVALGLDRLLMALTGADTIGAVMPFPKERA